MKLLSATILATALLAGCGSMHYPGSSMAADTPTRTVDGVLIGPSGKSLYVFGRDAAGSGKSACNDGCASNWPPLVAPADAKPMGGYSVIMRDDGARQWAYKGHPLYYWSKDMKPGDRGGDGMLQGAWKLARP